MEHNETGSDTLSYSSFDGYAAEVKSGRLEWSPVHRLDKF